MAIFNTNEFLRKTFSKTIFGTAALRPEAVCADGFTLSIQASGMHYCIPNEDLSDGNYSKVELSYLSEEVKEFLPFAEDDEAPLATVYGYVPEELRPQLTGKLMKIDISEPSYKELLQNYAGYKNAKNDSTKMFYYNMFRQGLDILDLDDFTYQMLEMNPNSMGFWFPPLVEGLYGSAFFKVPDTKILRVPITMLQLTRLGFETLNPVTKEIVNRYCQKVFHLDGYEDYFIKTGTYSSKYEFRNAHIHNPKEINEMGEYFLFLNHLTCSMASPLNNRCFYGANTTNEWVVREYIKDKENNPTIYNGLPLHTEYRVFVDFDTKEILGASPYWRSDVMKNEFKKVSSPQERHDYVVYKMHEDILNQRYHESVQTVLAELKKVIPRIELTGQWSVDVMRNGNDYYIIDMALAENSALNDCVPKNLLRAYPQQWLPGESNS